MNTLYNGSSNNINTEGGIIMKDSLKIEAKTGFDFLAKVASYGANYRLEKFYNLPVRRREELICEAFSMQLIRLCDANKVLSKFSFHKKADSIVVTKNVKVIIKGTDAEGKEVNKRANVQCIALRLKNPQVFENEFVGYYLELDPTEYNEEVLLTRAKKDICEEDFETFNVEISKSDKKLLDEASDVTFWKRMLPRFLFYKKDDAILLADFIDVLQSYKMIDLVGSEAVAMQKIYHEAMENFPLFKKMPLYDQLDLLNNACNKTGDSERVRSIHFMAKATFEEMEKLRLYTKFKFYEIVEEVRRDRLIDKNTIIKKELKFVVYKYEVVGGKTLKTCFSPYDLWSAMVPKYKKEEVVA